MVAWMPLPRWALMPGAADLTPVATPVGVPNADPSSQLIDSKGGSLSTSDGRFTLTIPPGAVSAPTNFTIQPLTNQAYGGIGSAYDLGPEGISLAAPATCVVPHPLAPKRVRRMASPSRMGNSAGSWSTAPPSTPRARLSVPTCRISALGRSSSASNSRRSQLPFCRARPCSSP